MRAKTTDSLSYATRVFFTLWVTYLTFLNPYLQSSMSWNFWDLAVSLVDSLSFSLKHGGFYGNVDTATVGSMLYSGEPPGMGVLLAPFYLLWKLLVGPVRTVWDFTLINTVATALLGATVSALSAVEVYRIVRHLGGAPRAGVTVSLLAGLGTSLFFYGTGIYKENFASFGVLLSFRLAIGSPRGRDQVLPGLTCGLTVLIAHWTAFLVPLLGGWMLVRRGGRGLFLFSVGGLPAAAALVLYNWTVFGSPWITGYSHLTGMAESGLVFPRMEILWALVFGLEAGVFSLCPVTILGAIGVMLERRLRAEALVAGIFFLSTLLLSCSWISQYPGTDISNGTVGPQVLLPAALLLLCFSAPVLDRLGRPFKATLSGLSCLFAYLGAQAGAIPGSKVHETWYALKVFVSGTGMSVLFKEALPEWLDVHTFHSVVRTPEVTIGNMAESFDVGRLLLAQAPFLVLNLAVWFCMALLVRALWLERHPRRRLTP